MLTGPAIRAEQPPSSSEPACRGRGPPLPSLATLAAAIALVDGTLIIVSRWGNMTVHLAAPKSATGGELRPPFLPSVLLSLACGPTLSVPRACGRESEKAARASRAARGGLGRARNLGRARVLSRPSNKSDLFHFFYSITVLDNV
jgi:hypothetical protein